MPTKKNTESYLELYDVAKKEKVTKALLAEIKFIPRTGERIFIAHRGPGDWDPIPSWLSSNFLGYDPSTG